MIDLATISLMGIGLVFYLALPIWGGLRASRSGHPGWAALSILSIFTGLGPIGGILALTSCVEPSANLSPRTIHIDGIDYSFERVFVRDALGSHKSGKYIIVLFTAKNEADHSRIVAAEKWTLLLNEETVITPEWSLNTAAEETFAGRSYHTTLAPNVEMKMIAAFEVSQNVYSDFVRSKTGLTILIPNIKDGMDERIEVKL